MRALLLLSALGLVALGLWMIAAVHVEPPQPAQPPVAAPAGPALVRREPNASPQILGMALVAGGVVLGLLILKRR